MISIGLLLFLSLFLIHALVLTHYLKYQSVLTKDEMQKDRHYVMLLMLIETSQADTPLTKEIVSDISHYSLMRDNAKLDISIGDKPEWNLQLKGKVEPYKLRRLIANSNDGMKLSYQLKNGKWLNYSEQYQYSTFQISTLLFSLELAAIVLLILYSLSMLRYTRPLRDFKSTAEKISNDINSEPITETSGPSIVRETSSALYQMQQRIKELVHNRTKLLATISHDLRTPITRLKLRAQFMADSELAEKVIADLDEMDAMISGMLAFARNDMIREKKIKFDLGAMLYTICNDFTDQGHRVHTKGNKQKLAYFGRSISLKRSISNLIHNAIKYAGEVWVTMEVESQRIIITVKDNGPGIPEDEIEKVFAAYYRAKARKADSSTGSGLGLAVVKEVIDDHKGTVTLKNRSQGGLIAVVVLPV